VITTLEKRELVQLPYRLSIKTSI